MHELIIEIIARGGYWGVFALMVIENVIPPIPSEVIMGVGGVLVARGEMQFWPLLIVGTIGTTAGNWAWFWIGRRWGYARLRPFVDRWGRWLTLEWRDVERAGAFFQRHGHWVVFGLRVSPFMRTMISLPAGMAGMPPLRFLVFTFTGSLLWNGALIAAGSWLAQYLRDAQGWLNWAIVGGVAAFAALYLWRVLTWTARGDGGED